MEIKVNFQGMESSKAEENHAIEKMQKVVKLIKEQWSPCRSEVHLKSHPNHAHQEVVIHVKGKNLDLSTSCQDPDMYKAVEMCVDKMVLLVKKEKDKTADKHKKVQTDKSNFYK